MSCGSLEGNGRISYCSACLRFNGEGGGLVPGVKQLTTHDEPPPLNPDLDSRCSPVHFFFFFFCSRIHQVAPSGVEGIFGAAGVRGSKREVLKKKCPFEVFEARSCAPCGFRSPFSLDLKGVVNKAGCIGVIGGGSSEREVGDDDAPVVTVGKKEGGEGGKKGRENGERRESRIRSSRECRGRSFFIWPIGGCCGSTPVCVIVLVLALGLE